MKSFKLWQFIDPEKLIFSYFTPHAIGKQSLKFMPFVDPEKSHLQKKSSSHRVTQFDGSEHLVLLCMERPSCHHLHHVTVVHDKTS